MRAYRSLGSTSRHFCFSMALSYQCSGDWLPHSAIGRPRNELEGATAIRKPEYGSGGAPVHGPPVHRSPEMTHLSVISATAERPLKARPRGEASRCPY